LGERDGRGLFLRVYIFEAFYEPIDDISYEGSNDGGNDQQHEIRRKNKHGFFPFGLIVICSVSQQKEGTDSQECTSKDARCQEMFRKFFEKKLDIFGTI
jgi:hypothetical protein